MMEKTELREVWQIWNTCYNNATDLAERIAASDVLELIHNLIAEKVINACLKDPLLDPDIALTDILKENGIPKKEWRAL